MNFQGLVVLGGRRRYDDMKQNTSQVIGVWNATLRDLADSILQETKKYHKHVGYVNRLAHQTGGYF